MDREPEQTFFQRRHRDDQQEHEKSFVTTSAFGGGSKLIKIQNISSSYTNQKRRNYNKDVFRHAMKEERKGKGGKEERRGRVEFRQPRKEKIKTGSRKTKCNARN